MSGNPFFPTEFQFPEGRRHRVVRPESVAPEGEIRYGRQPADDDRILLYGGREFAERAALDEGGHVVFSVSGGPWQRVTDTDPTEEQP